MAAMKASSLAGTGHGGEMSDVDEHNGAQGDKDGCARCAGIDARSADDYVTAAFHQFSRFTVPGRT
jgi:hypothetical protein